MICSLQMRMTLISGGPDRHSCREKSHQFRGKFLKTFRTAARLVLAGCASLPTIVLAQASADPEQSAPHETIVVTATGLSTALSTTKTHAPIIESPQTISIVNRDEIELRAASTIADALSYTAGVQSEPFGIDSRTDEVAVRGFSAGGFSANNNFVDGLRLPIGGQFSRFGFDPYSIEQIEVLKGPSSVLYGQTAPGGIVNLVTKRPTRTFQADAVAQLQTYTDLDNFSGRVGGDISGPLNDSASLSGRLVGLAHYGGTQVNDVENGRYYVSPSLTWEPSSDVSWTLLGQYQRDEGNATYQFLPATGTHYETNGGYIDKSANLGEPDWNTFDRDQMLAASFFEWHIGDSLTFRNNARYTHIESLFEVTVLAGDTVADCDDPTNPVAVAAGANCVDGQTIGRRAIRADGFSDGFAVDNQLQLDVATGPIEHTVLGGFDYFYTNYEHYRDVVMLPGLPPGQVDPLFDIFDPVPRGSDHYEENLAPQIYTAATSEQTGLYLQDQMAIGNLRLSIGGRYDWADDEVSNLVANSQTDYQADAFTWRAGAVYLFDNGLAPYVSYSESFLPQLVDPSGTLGGVPFEPTTGTQYEAGLRYQGGRGIYLTASAFEITQQNVPVRDPGGTMCGRLVCQVQAGEARVRGLEFEGRASLAQGTTLIASATHLDAEITEDTDGSIVGNTMPQVPSYLASLFVNHTIGGGAFEGLGFGGGMRHTGGSYGDTNNTFDVGAYTLFDLFLRYDVPSGPMEGIAFSLNARNLADKRFVVTCASPAACYYGQGRVITARVSFAW